MITTFDSSGTILGTTAGGDGDAFQCIELIERYAYLRWGYPATQWVGDAGDTFDQGNHPKDFTQYYNDGTATAPPQAGDILVWKDLNPDGSKHGPGHIAIVATSGNGQITTLEQNFYFWNKNKSPGGWYGDQSTRTITYSSTNGHYQLADSYNVGSYFDNFDYPITGWLHQGATSGDTNPTYTSHEEYLIDSNGQLYHYFYTPQSNWSPSPQENLSAITGDTGDHLQGNVTSYYFGGSHYAYAIDTNGYLHEFYYASGWHQQIVESGYTFQGSPSAYAFNDPTDYNTPRHSINVVGTNGELYNVSFSYPKDSSKGTWGITLGESGSITGSPSGYSVINGSTYYELVYVVANGALKEYEDVNGSWTALASWPTLATGVTAQGTPSAYPFQDSAGHQEHSIVVQGSDNKLYNIQYRYSSSTKKSAWQTAFTQVSATTTTGVPNAHISYQSTGNVHLVFAESNGGALMEFWANDGSGTWYPLTRVSSGLNGSPWSYTYNATNGTLVHIIFYPETDGDLHEMYYQSTTGWSIDIDRGNLTSGATVNSGANGYGF